MPASAAERAVTVLTYNMNHGAGDPCTPQAPVVVPDCSTLKLQLAAHVIRESAADLVGLQEVDRFWTRSGYVDQATLLARELGMSLCFGANLKHGPDQHSPLDHEYGTAVLSRLRILRCRNTLLPKANAGTEQRGLAEVVVSASGRRVSFSTTHLQNCSPKLVDPCGAGNPDRFVQVRAIVDVLRNERRAIVTGDFNAQPGWPELRAMRRRFDDAWVRRGAGPGHTYPAHPVEPSVRRIDYVFVRGVSVRSADVPVDAFSRFASDHYPVASGVVVR